MGFGPGQRRDPQPLARGGEAALVAFAAAAVLAGLAALAGLGAAAALAGGGWVWPHGITAAGRILGGLLSGHPRRGLPPAVTARMPGPAAIWTGVALAEAALLALAGGLAALWWRWQPPGDTRRGMATRAEAAGVLGRRRLRDARTIIRPDLYGTPGGDR